MALWSIPGFARADGVSGPYAWAWELKSVNAKGLELRLRTPPGWDAVEVPLRAKAAEALARGTPRGREAGRGARARHCARDRRRAARRRRPGGARQRAGARRAARHDRR